MEDILLISLVAGIVTGFIGSYVAGEKGRSNLEGFIFGFLLSVIGIIIVGILPTKEKPKKKELSPEEIEKRKESLKKHDTKMNRVLYIIGLIAAVLMIVAAFIRET